MLQFPALGRHHRFPQRARRQCQSPARRRSPSPPRDTPSTVAWQSRWNREARCRERGIEPQQRAYQSPLGLATGAYKQGSAASSSSTDLYKTGHLVEGSCTLKKQGRSAALFWSASQLSRERLATVESRAAPVAWLLSLPRCLSFSWSWYCSCLLGLAVGSSEPHRSGALLEAAYVGIRVTNLPSPPSLDLHK